MGKRYECCECGRLVSESKIDWSISEPENDAYYCEKCGEWLEEVGRDALDPYEDGYDEYGNWDEERLGF